mmetsp:Transcript_36214/g.82971  ORF Transcript_36214/g.82971 Transcript_36214/m.82971 type:complete len:398 (-) Transcript_36214:22-1215(-)
MRLTTGDYMKCPPLSEASVPTSNLDAVATWHPAPRAASWPNNTNIFMFLPDISSDEEAVAARAVVQANQFPDDAKACERVLLVHDDAIGTGLGYTARLLMIALFVAVKEHRVLMSVPRAPNRWCAKPPYTLNCMYDPWTHCPLPLNTSSAYKWNHKSSWREGPTPAIVRLSTSQIHKEIFFMKTHPAPELRAAAFEVLFRPRAWVREAAHCTMHRFGLKPGNFLVLHARFSSEKKKERGVGLPPLEAYLPAAQSAMRRHNISTIFLQTATPIALEHVAKWCNETNTRLVYTENERTTHDLWMTGTRQDRSGERASVVAQAVNALIASRATVFISPAVSMWTIFVQGLMHRPHEHLLAKATPSESSHLLSEIVRTQRNHSRKRIVQQHKSELRSLHRV